MKIILIIITTLLLTACTPHMMMEHPQITSEEIFISEMIPHHQEAVESSEQMLNSQNSQVKTLAENIISAQEQEINMMQNWINTWYQSSTYQSSYKTMMPNLNSLEGVAKDKAYLKGMISHHQGAIEMAKQAQTLDLRPEVRKLTEDIISTQEAEITLINQLLNE